MTQRLRCGTERRVFGRSWRSRPFLEGDLHITTAPVFLFARQEEDFKGYNRNSTGWRRGGNFSQKSLERVRPLLHSLVR